MSTLSEIGSTMEAAVDAWMSTVISAPSLHWANITLGGFLGGSNAVTNIHRFADTGNVRKYMVAYLTIGATAILDSLGGVGGNATKALRTTAQIANAVADELKDPNIEGIPIHAEREIESRDVEVSKQVVIAMTEKDLLGSNEIVASSNKDVVLDNAVPQLKQWQISGYLTSFPEGLDPFLIIKPGLKAQKLLLDLYATSRRPVWFKTHDGQFVKVLIAHVDTTYTTQALNAVAVNLTLVEFKALVMSKSSLGMIMAKVRG